MRYLTNLSLILSGVFFIACLPIPEFSEQKPAMTQEQHDAAIKAAGGKVYYPQKITKEQAEAQKKKMEEFDTWRYSRS